ncbi:hypothetical protein TSUD_336960 [Trifolium subterraneum]|uniref:Uncharacterized protein n=1 Tax=Trifolium subterraneum TaxID=3900 RepID=A0A2Z6LXJ6_TRISU|nr:hypothetical protein TSUD_336960 [Trifolium subterraneum]
MLLKSNVNGVLTKVGEKITSGLDGARSGKVIIELDSHGCKKTYLDGVCEITLVQWGTTKTVLKAPCKCLQVLS